jgi:hypothetical protein
MMDEIPVDSRYYARAGYRTLSDNCPIRRANRRAIDSYWGDQPASCRFQMPSATVKGMCCCFAAMTTRTTA